MKMDDLRRSINSITPDQKLKQRILALPERPSRPRLETPLLKVGALGAACLLCAGVFVAVITLGNGGPSSNPANLANQPGTSQQTEAATPSPEQSPTPAPSAINMLAPTAPKLVAGQNIGADMAELDYASGDTVIFHGYFGLFVYDLKSEKIIRSLDLALIGCSYTQGDDFCEVTVNADGSTVQLHPVSSKKMYVYDVSDNTLQETDYQPMKDKFTGFVDAEDPVYQKIYQKAAGSSYQAVRFDTGDYGYLVTTDWTLGTLTYVRGDIAYRLFKSMNPAATLSPSGDNKAPLIKSTLPEGIISPEEALSIAKQAIKQQYGQDTGDCTVIDTFSGPQTTVYVTGELWDPLFVQNDFAGKMILLMSFTPEEAAKGTSSDARLHVHSWVFELRSDGAYEGTENVPVTKIIIDAKSGDILEIESSTLTP